MLLLSLAVALTACRRDMADQPRFDTYQANHFFPNGAAARPLPPHTLAQGDLNEDTHFHTGRTDAGELALTFPAPITRATLERGRERYNIHCAPCHGATGDGRGMVVQRGFPAPPSYHQPRLREAPPGHFFEVITRGHGVMYPAGYRVAPADRWAIAAYIRALQASQHTPVAELTAAERAPLDALPPP